ncbi:MAG: hypothetical protein N4A49_00705 [Marinifilaceae bacterium]|jgi:hypothetical protein|nr:hypothetical protein [Marinifilaceae bacterium]
MDINTWLTVITVFTAIIALIPKDDLNLNLNSISKFEKILAVVLLLFVIPYLIYFENLADVITLLNVFTITKGFAPTNIAFSIFYVVFIWFLVRLFVFKSKITITPKNLEYLTDILNRKSFDEFFKLFTKYNSKTMISKNWDEYKNIILNPSFLNNVVVNNSNYLLQYWEKLNEENDFQQIFRLFLENPHSAYYSEIKTHWNSYELLEDNPFLKTIIKDNLTLSINNGILRCFADFVSNQLQQEANSNSFYNQGFQLSRIRENQGWDLPVYYHIRFIGLLYSTAIRNKVDISMLSHRYTNMQTIYSSIIKQLIENISRDNIDLEKEYPSNNHWLISEIFSLQSEWLSSFGDEYSDEKYYFDETSSYVSFIPFSLRLCLNELHDGFSKLKISKDFLINKYYYNVLSHYFSHSLNRKVKESIENEILLKIPQNIKEDVYNYAFDEKYAITLEDFKNNKFEKLRESEIAILNDLKKIFN